MINKLCKICVSTCKQEDSVKIVSCPKFQENPTEKEFQEMLNELDAAETEAKNIQKRTKNIISKVLSENKNEQDDSEKDEE